MANGTPLVEKSFAVSTRCIRLNQYLNQQKEFVIAKQVLRSGTSIGANVQEAVAAESRADFIHKLSILLKETKETMYWVRQLALTGYLTLVMKRSLLKDLEEVFRLLNASIKTAKSLR